MHTLAELMGPSASVFSPVTTPTVEAMVGRAFERTWREGTGAADRELRDAIVSLVTRRRRDKIPLEGIIVQFKQAIRRFGGVHSYPTLVAEEHSIDGEECAAAYESAFACLPPADRRQALLASSPRTGGPGRFRSRGMARRLRTDPVNRVVPAAGGGREGKLRSAATPHRSLGRPPAATAV